MNTELVEKYRALILSISKKFYKAPKEDLIQAGFLGLTKAYKNYDIKMGVKFSTYAYQYIFGEMYETENSNRPIKLQKKSLSLYRNVLKTQELLSQKKGRNVSLEETTAYLNIDYNVFLSILNSLEESISIEQNEINIPMEEKIDDLLLLKDCLLELSSLEKEVIKSRYFEDLSQSETAKILGLSQVKISRIEAKSKEKMRKYINS